MIRNAWHISGGSGWSANTTCRRVLVTRFDGTQEVVEIKNDLGVGNDINSIKAALRRQGEDFQVLTRLPRSPSLLRCQCYAVPFPLLASAPDSFRPRRSSFLHSLCPCSPLPCTALTTRRRPPRLALRPPLAGSPLVAAALRSAAPSPSNHNPRNARCFRTEMLQLLTSMLPLPSTPMCCLPRSSGFTNSPLHASRAHFQR